MRKLSCLVLYSVGILLSAVVWQLFTQENVSANDPIDYAALCRGQYDDSVDGEGVAKDPRYAACMAGVDIYAKDSTDTCQDRARGYGTAGPGLTQQQFIDICQQSHDTLKRYNVPRAYIRGGDCDELNSNGGYKVQSDFSELCAGAPKGYVFPDIDSTVRGTKFASEYCKYYDTPEEQRFNPDAIREACIIGYEVGFGQDKICSFNYLVSDLSVSIDHAGARLDKIVTYGMFVRNIYTTYEIYGGGDYVSPKNKKKIAYHGAILEACRDGWTQYKVDYWFCNKDKACQESLRAEKKRVYDPGPPPGRQTNLDSTNPNSTQPLALRSADGQDCGGIDTAYFTCGIGNRLETSGIWSIATIILNILIALVGIAAVGGVAWGAIRYSASGDNSSNRQQALEIIRNTVIGLVLFIAMWAIMQYIIPGGIFS